MKIVINGADLVHFPISLYLAFNFSYWWLLYTSILVMGCFVKPMWELKNGWRLFHD